MSTTEDTGRERFALNRADVLEICFCANAVEPKSEAELKKAAVKIKRVKSALNPIVKLLANVIARSFEINVFEIRHFNRRANRRSPKCLE
jgi:hypothetical protein